MRSASHCDRNRLLGQKGAIVWFIGLSGSDKSSVAVALESELAKRGKLAYRLDGDNVRLGINKNLGFSAEDRTENIRRIGEVSKLFVDAGVIVLSSFVSPYRADRDLVRKLHVDGAMDFAGVQVFRTIETMPLNHSRSICSSTLVSKPNNLHFFS